MRAADAAGHGRPGHDRQDEAGTLPRLGRVARWPTRPAGRSSTPAAPTPRRGRGGGLRRRARRGRRGQWRGCTGRRANVGYSTARPHTAAVMTVDADDTFHGAIGGAGPRRLRRRRGRLPGGARSATGSRGSSGPTPTGPGTGRPTSTWPRQPAPAVSSGRPPSPSSTSADGGTWASKFERELALLQADHRDQLRTIRGRRSTWPGRTRTVASQPGQRRGTASASSSLGWDEETCVRPLATGHLFSWAVAASTRAAASCGAPGRAAAVAGRTRSRRSPSRAPTASWPSRVPSRSKPVTWRRPPLRCRLAQCRLGPVSACRSRGTASAGDRLFVHLDVYQWRIAYEQSIQQQFVRQANKKDLGRCARGRAADSDGDVPRRHRHQPRRETAASTSA